ncbi:hypothetical protein [Aquimarina spongiae]|uniref:Outer membrane insertion C-terminal signal n=1 Tax=Aquimarina spongiae TaxID=570521 RepID=A0A1M6ASV8_9FLAO|nr:hypothetical protein [Aquimarina spongiae]SHI39408.1 hypothetical protein SAMN04488508_101451 [Aquimarina spongiae]
MTKRILFIVAFIVASISTVQSQEISKHALGLRLGDDDGFGAEISYQLGLSGNNRLEFDLGWRDFDFGDAIKFTGLYQWVFNLDKGFNWYVGPGGGFVYVDLDDNFPGGDDSDTYLFIAGDIGIEYNFNIPILISLDFRPEIGFGDNDDDLDFDLGLGIRYQF